MDIDRSPLTYEDLRIKLPIDAMKIDEEMQTHAVDYEIVCLETARYGHMIQKIKIQLDTLEASTKIETRKMFESQSKKPTEGTIQERVDVDAHIVTIKNHLADADYEYERWYGLKKAFEHKHEAMMRMVNLIISGYMGHGRSYEKSR